MVDVLVHVGNTHTLFARLVQGRVVDKRRVGSAALVTVLADGFWQDWLQRGTRFFVGGVVPDLLDWLLENASQWCLGAPQRLSVEDARGLLEIRYAPPLTLGFDRVCVLLGAQKRHPGQSCIVVDMGTATTVDLLVEGQRFVGGVIMPGMQACLDALHQSTALLPALSAESPLPSGAFGGSTQEGMRLGARQMVAGGLKQTLAALLGQYPQAVVLVTGGAVSGFLWALEGFSAQHVDDLLLEGMVRLVGEAGDA